MPTTTVGLLHPGEMGSAVGAAARAAGVRVVWASEGRSTQTRDRAVASGIDDVVALDALVAQSDMILSVCPPDAALDVARSVAARGFPGVYVDANAVSPATARNIAAVIERAGGTLVDGGIIGPPPVKSGTSRLYLSGREAKRAATLFADGPLEAIVLNAPVGAASALKMAYASWTKGSAALLIAVRALAVAAGIEADLLSEWERSLPGLAARSDATVNANFRKAWRFVGEMEEIANTFAAAGLPNGFHSAARDIYQRLEQYKDASSPPSFAEAAEVILNACPAPAPSKTSTSP